MSDYLGRHVAAYEGNNLYDFDNEIMLNWYPKQVLKLAGHSRTILELGLGHGFTTNLFSHHFNRHVVLEGSLAVIDNFKKKYPQCRAHLIETYFENYESDEKFDVIVLGFILEHVDNPFQILNHYKKFLAQQGKMFVAVPNAESLNRRLGHVAGMLPDIEALSDNDLLLGHKRYYTVSSLTQEMKNAGYEIERIEGIYMKPFMSSQIIALNLEPRMLNALCEVGVDYPELSCGILVQVKAV
jgi:trans-aconitate methyltransferase